MWHIPRMLFQGIGWVVEQCFLPNQNYFISLFNNITTAAIHCQMPQSAILKYFTD